MTKMKISELTGPALDWAVATCEGLDYYYPEIGPSQPEYSTDWSQGGPIVERERVALWPDEEGGFFASADEGAGKDFHGPTPLIAAMRAFVASKLGDEVNVPEDLL